MSTAGINSDDQRIDDPEILERVSRYVEWDKLPSNHFINQIEKGRQGYNVGLPNGLTSINKYTFGTRRGMYYLIGADSGVGKTTLTDFMMVLKAYEHCKKMGKKLYIYYYSFEISRYMKSLKWVSYYIFEKYGVLLPTAYIGGNIQSKMVSDEHMEMIRFAYAYVEEIMESIVFVEEPTNPTAVFTQLLEHFESIGKASRTKPTTQHPKGLITGYKFNAGEEDSMTLAMLDHGALLMSEQNFSTKQTMDLMSKYFVMLRNIFSLTVGFVQQFNSELVTMNRDTWKKVNEASIMPQRVDFGDSTYTYRDADVVFGLISPAKFDMKSFLGYDVVVLGTRLILLCLMKNRYGEADHALPLMINPIAGTFHDLPHPGFLDKYLNLNKEIDKCLLHYQ